MTRVRGLARAQGSSVFRTLLAAFAVMLRRWTGETEIVVGTTLLGRGTPGAAGVVGFLNNPAALRLTVEPGVDFTTLIRAVHRSVGEAVKHQEYPFSRLASTWKGARAANRIGWGGVGFTKLPERVVLRHGSWEARERRVFSDRSAHELAFYVQEQGDEAEVICEFNAILYPVESVERWLGQFRRFLDAVTLRPEASVLAPSWIGPEDERVLPDPRLPLERPCYPGVVEALERRWNESAGSPAIRHAGREWSYGDLREASVRIAAELVRLGMPAGAVVGVTGVRSFGFVAGVVGVWWARGVLLTLDPQLPLERRRLMTREAGVWGMIVVGESRTEEAASWRSEDPERTVIEVTGDGTRCGFTRGGEGRERKVVGCLGAEAAYLFFTSGTTGVPKAVVGSHAGLGHFLAWQRTLFGIGAADRAAQLTGLSFDVFLRDVFTPLTAGATLCLPTSDEEHLSGGLMAWLESERVTMLHAVPSLAEAWLESGRNPDAVRSKALRLTFFAGEPLTAALVRRWRVAFPGTRILNLYGPTETTLAKCYHEIGAEPDPGIQPVGRPQPETQVWVVNPEGTRCAVGEPGEIVIRTPFRSLGYLGAPEETARRFVPNPFRSDPEDWVYRTGDRGRCRADGVLEILGRVDDQVKVRGVRIELSEVAAALGAHPAVRAAVAMVREDEGSRKRLVGYVVPRGDGHRLPAALIEFLQRRLPSAFVPETILVLERMPLTANGKVDRRALPAPSRVSPGSVLPVEPRTLTECQVTDLAREILGNARLGPDDHFFEAGGHSLAALRWLAEVRRVLGVDVPLRALFESPTPAALARVVEVERARGPRPDWNSLTPLHRGQPDRPGLFVFAGGNGGDRELYSYDGETLTRIAIVADESSDPQEIVGLGDTAFFVAGTWDDRELWSYSNGRLREYDLNANGSSSPSDLKVIDDTLYFSATVGGDRELWGFDGSRTFEVDVYPGGSSSPFGFEGF